MLFLQTAQKKSPRDFYSNLAAELCNITRSLKRLNHFSLLMVLNFLFRGNKIHSENHSLLSDSCNKLGRRKWDRTKTSLFFIVANCLLIFRPLQIVRICIWSLLFLISYQSAQGWGKGITLAHFSVLFPFAERITVCPPRGNGVSRLIKP